MIKDNVFPSWKLIIWLKNERVLPKNCSFFPEEKNDSLSTWGGSAPHPLASVPIAGFQKRISATLSWPPAKGKWRGGRFQKRVGESINKTDVVKNEICSSDRTKKMPKGIPNMTELCWLKTIGQSVFQFNAFHPAANVDFYADQKRPDVFRHVLVLFFLISIRFLVYWYSDFLVSRFYRQFENFLTALCLILLLFLSLHWG